MVLSGQTGAVAYSFIPQRFQNLMKPLVLFAAGTLIGASLLHLLPESIRHSSNYVLTVVMYVLGLFAFYFIGLFIKKINPKKNFSYVILTGDFIHNMVGGIAISSSYLIDISLGITTTIAALAHEVPHKVGNYFLLLYNEMPPWKASLSIFIVTSPFIFLGIWVWYGLYPLPTEYLLPFAAGNFIYTGLLALKISFEKKEFTIKSFIFPVFGIILLFLLNLVFSHH